MKEEGLAERTDTIEARMKRLEEFVKLFKLEFHQLLRTEMMKHLGHIPTENRSSNWSVFLITSARK